MTRRVVETLVNLLSARGLGTMHGGVSWAGKKGRNRRLPCLAAWFLASISLLGGPDFAQRSTTAKLAPKQESPSAGQAQFDEAEKLLRQGDLENARSAALAGLKLAPKSIEGLNLLGIIYGQQRNYDQSVAAFEQALRWEPRSTRTHVNLGNTYFAERKLDQSAAEFRAALRLDPKNHEANFNLGLVLMAQGRPDQAIEAFRRVQPPDPSTALNLIQAYFRARQAPKALQAAKALSEGSKNDPRVHFSLGVLLAGEKQYAPAIHELEMADALQPGTFEILHDLGQAYLRNHNDVQAEQVLNRALLLRPDSADTLYLLAQAYTDEQKHIPALELLVRAHKLAPENTDIIFLMARVSMMQSYFEDAIQILEEGVRIAPQRADLHAALGESYFTAGKVDRAMSEFQSLLRLDSSARSYLFMGLSYRHLGRYDEARNYFNEGLKKDPANAPCLYNLGYINHKQGNNAEAEKYLAQALRINPDYEDALYEMAGVKMSQKRYEEAIPLLRRAAKLMDEPSEAYYKLATAERNLHQTEAAQRDMKVFETLSKDPKPAPYPLQHLFDFVSQRATLPEERKAEVDLEEVKAELERHPGRPGELFHLAETYLKLGRTDEALQAVAQLDAASGGDARTAIGVGVLLGRYSRYKEAIQHFQMALAADPASDDAKYDLADAYFRARAYSEALAVMQQVSAQAQQDDAYLALLGDIDAHLGRTAEAAGIFQKAIEKNPDNEQYILSLALTEMRVGDIAAAEATLGRGLKRIPDSGRLCWGMAVASVLAGKNDDAAKYFSRAIDLLPEWQSGYSALGVFYFVTGQIPQARETLDRYRSLFPHGGLNVEQIQRVLANYPPGEQLKGHGKSLAPDERAQFLQTALAMNDLSP